MCVSCNDIILPHDAFYLLQLPTPACFPAIPLLSSLSLSRSLKYCPVVGVAMGSVTQTLKRVNVLPASWETIAPVSLHLSLCVCVSFSLPLFFSFSLSPPSLSDIFVVCDVSLLCQLRSFCSFVSGVFRLVSDWSVFFLFVLCCAVSVFSVSKGVARLMCPVPVRFVSSLIGCPSLSVGGVPRFPVILAVYCPFRVMMYDVVCL